MRWSHSSLQSYVYHLVKLVENVASSQVDRTPVDGDMCEVEKARVLELRHQSGDKKMRLLSFSNIEIVTF